MSLETARVEFEEVIEGDDLLTKIKEKEKAIKTLEQELAQHRFQLQEMRRVNAESVTIKWKESIKWRLSVDAGSPYFFIKTPAFVSKCIAQKHGIEITRDIKNKIATTLSIMHNQKLIGRIHYNGSSFYGLPDFFNEDLITLKEEYKERLNTLRQ